MVAWIPSTQPTSPWPFGSGTIIITTGEPRDCSPRGGGARAGMVQMARFTHRGYRRMTKCGYCKACSALRWFCSRPARRRFTHRRRHAPGPRRRDLRQWFCSPSASAIATCGERSSAGRQPVRSNTVVPGRTPASDVVCPLIALVVGVLVLRYPLLRAARDSRQNCFKLEIERGEIRIDTFQQRII
jgi:hypothetical protein